MRAILFLSAFSIVLIAGDGRGQLITPKGKTPIGKDLPPPVRTFEASDWPWYGLWLLEDSGIQSELKMTADQKAELAKVRTSWGTDPNRAKFIEEAESSARVIPDGRGGTIKLPSGPGLSKLRGLDNQYSSAALKLLDENQRARVEQIVWQFRYRHDYYFVLYESPIKEAVKLTEAQEAKIGKIAADRLLADDKLPQKKGATAASIATERARLWKTSTEQIMAVLTDEQKAAFKKFLGPTYSGTPKNIRLVGH